MANSGHSQQFNKNFKKIPIVAKSVYIKFYLFKSKSVKSMNKFQNYLKINLNYIQIIII